MPACIVVEVVAVPLHIVQHIVGSITTQLKLFRVNLGMDKQIYLPLGIIESLSPYTCRDGNVISSS